jgi:putative DNA primase/helicase
VPYIPGASSEAWLQFLSAVVAGGEEVRHFLQEAGGYGLTGHTREEKLFYLFGDPRSGKGTFTETMLALLRKPLSSPVSFLTFAETRAPDANNFDLAPLKPARFVVASEGKRHERLDAAKIKHLTGGDSVYCSHKHKPHFSYRPQYKLWLASNYDVNIDVDDHAAWGRVVRLHFPHSFLGHEDKTLKHRLKTGENLTGILAWAVEGAKRWYAKTEGLQVPPQLQVALQEVRQGQDIIQPWLDERTMQAPGEWEAHGVLYKDYEY